MVVTGADTNCYFTVLSFRIDDFLVNEVDIYGATLHLKNLEADQEEVRLNYIPLYWVLPLDLDNTLAKQYLGLITPPTLSKSDPIWLVPCTSVEKHID